MENLEVKSREQSTSPIANPAFWSGKRVFLTGHTGFKGSWLSLWLQKMGAVVHGYSLPPEGSKNLFQNGNLNRTIAGRYADITDFATLFEEIDKFVPEIVIHMAAQALVRRSYQQPMFTYATNVMGTVHVLEAARKIPQIRAILVVTSDKCYDIDKTTRPFIESDAMGGHDPYSNSKGCAELVSHSYLHSFFRDQGVGLATARSGNVIGGGDWASDRLIPDCIRSLQTTTKEISIRNPNAVRPWQHVLEPLGGYLRLIEKMYQEPSLFSQGWNFGPDTIHMEPVSTIASMVVNQWGSGKWTTPANSKQPFETDRLLLNCEKAKKELHWQTQLNLAETLQWTVEWYRREFSGENPRDLCLEQIQKYETLGSASIAGNP